MQPMVLAEGLTKNYGNFAAVDGINFRVEEGDLFGFLGPNGAGKTTTMKMIQCVSPKTSGKLEVAGMEVDGHERKIKKLIGVAPQEINLDPDFTIYDNLRVYSRYFDIHKDEAKSRIHKLLEFVQLQDKKDTNIDKLSGGMKRRLILARALINKPKILILDEPTVGLDPQARHLIWDKLKRLKSEGTTIILTTHYMEEAAQLCDRLVIMDKGKIISQGRPVDLIREHVGPSVIEVTYDSHLMQCLESMKGIKFEVVGDLVHIFTDKPKDLISTLLDECRLGKVTVRETTLEDVFLKLTGRQLKE